MDGSSPLWRSHWKFVRRGLFFGSLAVVLLVCLVVPGMLIHWLIPAISLGEASILTGVLAILISVWMAIAAAALSFDSIQEQLENLTAAHEEDEDEEVHIEELRGAVREIIMQRVQRWEEDTFPERSRKNRRPVR